uniref:Rho-GAP domain-containing protein n=1 Tax=Apteryx owenii TaxID=8824 RepID=A0A8B9SBC9_APTOW
FIFSSPLSSPRLHSAARNCISALLPGNSTKMQPVPLHSLSELERASLQELALYQLQEKLLVGDLSLAKGRRWEKTVLLREGWHLSHYYNSPPLPHFITLDDIYGMIFVTPTYDFWFILFFLPCFGPSLQGLISLLKEALSSSGWPFSATEETQNDSCHPANCLCALSQGAMSVDSITDLSDNTSKLLEALQLSHPHELDLRRSRGKKKMLSLNPITWQVPRIVERCCQHIEMHGLQTVGIFRVGSSKKRVQQVNKRSENDWAGMTPLRFTVQRLWAWIPGSSYACMLALLSLSS